MRMNASRSLLLEALRHPDIGLSASPAEWDLLLRQARYAGVLARLCLHLQERDLLDELSPKVYEWLKAARVVAEAQERTLRWEVSRLQCVLEPLGIPIILLKGAAYALASLPPARGRLAADVDIMVPKARIAEAEAALLSHGWEHITLNAYDQRYYRTWMHELPPLRHRERQTVVDVHHTILPQTSRLRPDPQYLWDAAQQLPDSPLCVLAPADMVLHCATHLFQDGEIAGDLRDLTDLDDLLQHFGTQPNFWENLVHRASLLHLERPWFYGLRYAVRLFNTPVPADVMSVAHASAPPPLVLRLMDTLVLQALVSFLPETTSWKSGLACWLLYVRSHALRMPPWLLAGHLFCKSLRLWTMLLQRKHAS
jgi:hypothetical protein